MKGAKKKKAKKADEKLESSNISILNANGKYEGKDSYK